MRKILMTIAGALVLGVTAVNAQSDTTQRQRNQPPGEVTPLPQTPQQQQQSMYRTQDRVTVPTDQVPSSLRQTLQGSQYKGWETVPLYQDRVSQEYYFEIPDANGTTRRMHRFDRNGKDLSGSKSNATGVNPGTSPSGTDPKPETKPQN